METLAVQKYREITAEKKYMVSISLNFIDAEFSDSHVP